MAHRGTRERLALLQAETAQAAALAEARRTEAAARRDRLALALAPRLPLRESTTRPRRGWPNG
ncbi:hypothetical protein PUH89_08295 [Rhodobacter capsulatus]|uniref:hypothetical protein n=1 Tax=Rhodobacter capsulatus TaxID=1061 RepID=UPI0023E315C8|nr:hypothetical protein [Rhodobacter capsulatus]WER10961.1 hypothetical protein PUH89_08295 [Rhodobacter capsulatus]